ncbi:MAG TPA: hypothetical protein VLJ39_17045 [Tepidisphaeraceae bacterium]|nr:hypothetical protein [Tepidisphaeraceae bacterium]
MWGNWQGWTISAVMLLFSGVLFWAMALPPHESAPAGLIPLAYKPVALPVPADVVRPPGTKDCDASALYRDAITLYLQDPKPYETPAKFPVSKLPAIAKVVEATDCARMDLFQTNPKQVINYDNQKPWIDALMAVGTATNTIGLLEKSQGHDDEAMKYFDATFSLGRRMFDERMAWPEINKGLSLMTMATKEMTEIADKRKDGARVDVLQHFTQEGDNYHTKLQEDVAVRIGNPVESYGAKYSGDIYSIAKNPAVDRVWRVEAILHIGHYQWNVDSDHKGDQVWAKQELQALEKSIDPKNQDVAIKTAVKAAENLTLEQQRMTGGGS